MDISGQCLCLYKCSSIQFCNVSLLVKKHENIITLKRKRRVEACILKLDGKVMANMFRDYDGASLGKDRTITVDCYAALLKQAVKIKLDNRIYFVMD